MSYYRTVLTIEVLGTRPFEGDVDDLRDEITDGEYSGRTLNVDTQEVSAGQMAKLLIEQGSDPGFLGIDEAPDSGMTAIFPELATEVRVNPTLVERAERAGPMIATDDGFDVFYRGDGEEALVTAFDGASNTTTIVSVYGDIHRDPTMGTVKGTWAKYELPE